MVQKVVPNLNLRSVIPREFVPLPESGPDGVDRCDVQVGQRMDEADGHHLPALKVPRSLPGRLWRERRVIDPADFAAGEAPSRTAKNWRNMVGSPFVSNASPCFSGPRAPLPTMRRSGRGSVRERSIFFRRPIDGRVTDGLAALGDGREATATSLRKEHARAGRETVGGRWVSIGSTSKRPRHQSVPAVAEGLAPTPEPGAPSETPALPVHLNGTRAPPPRQRRREMTVLSGSDLLARDGCVAKPHLRTRGPFAYINSGQGYTRYLCAIC